MLTQEDLVRVWSKGQPGLGLYLGCRAVRRVGVEGEGGEDQGDEELTVVTVDNVVDGMARVRTEEGMIMSAATDTLVLFKSAPKVQIAQPPNSRIKSARGRTHGRGQYHEDQKEENEKEKADNSLDWMSGAGSKTGTNMFDCMGFVKPILADASLTANETTEKEGVEWETGLSSHRGDHFMDCLDQVRPLHGATKSTTGRSRNDKRGRPVQSSRTRRDDRKADAATLDHIGRAIASAGSKVRIAGCRSRRERSSETWQRGGMDSPTMEEGEEKEPTDMKNVSSLLKQLKVARGDEGKPGNGISDQNGDLTYAASEKQTYRTSREGQVEEEELKKSSRDNSVEAYGQVDELRGGNAMKCEAGERIEVSGHKFEGQLESRVDGGEIPNVLTSECLSDFKNSEHESQSTSLDEDIILPTSLPTSASVSRWIEGEQLHRVDSEETWLPAILPEDAIFTCMCWHVDWDGTLTLSTGAHQEGLRVISKVLNAKFQDSEVPPADLHEWKKGDRCIANFHLDGGWYRGIVTRVKSHHMVDRDQAKAYVQFVDYGSTSWVDVTKLRRGSCMSDLPIQSIRLKMKDLVPMNLTTWDKKALDLLHATLVDRHLKVEVDGEAKNPMDANVFIGNIDIGKMLVANGFARRRGDFDHTMPREEMY